MYKNKGLTMFELIFTMLIITIIAVIAIPSIQSMLQTQEAQSIQSNFPLLIKEARNQSLLTRNDTVICGSSNKQTCTGDWSQHVIAFIDNNENGQHDSNEAIFSSDSPNLKYGNLKWKGLGQKPYIRMQSENGLPNGSNGSLIYCGQENIYHRQVILARSGRIDASRDTNRDGIYEQANGQPINCN